MSRARRTVFVALLIALSACEATSSTPSSSVTDRSEPSDASEPSDSSVDCSEEALQGGDEEFVFTSAYEVVDGELGPLSFGDDDPIVVDAWEALTSISPSDQRSDIVLFGGFEPDGPPADETMAFVNAVDSDGSGFQMSINTIDAQADPTELLLTIAHEFSHVFTATAEQLDRTDEAIEDCSTYFNGDGCYRSDSLLHAWIVEFWDPDVVAGVDPHVESIDDADARCAADDGFFGPYAATNPEEDFAEAFSAFVFGLEPETDGQARRLEWIGEQAGLIEFSERAQSAGMAPLANTFDVCGT